MASCTELEIGLDPSCAALAKVGGVHPRVWICQRKHIAAYVFDGTNKNIASFTMGLVSVGLYYKLHKFISKRDKHNFTAKGTAGDNTPTYLHTGILQLAAFTQLEANAVEALFAADDLVVFIQTNADQIKVYGHGIGLNGKDLEMPEGVLLNDSTMLTITLEGEERKLPMVFDTATATLAANIIYLDAKDGTAA